MGDTETGGLLKNLAAVVFGLFLAFLVLEMALGFGLIPGYYPTHKFCGGERVRGAFHPVYGWTERPGSKYLEKKSPVRPYVLHTYNKKGFRDTYDSGREQRVLVLGDSFTRGSLADDNSTYPFLLDRWAPNTSFENYGIGGYGTNQEYLLYRDLVEKKDHSLVILGYHLGNDPIDNTKDSARRPKIELVNGSLKLVKKPSRLSLLGVMTAPGISKVNGLLRTHTRSFGFIKKQALGLIRSQEPNRTAPRGEELEKQLKLTEELLREIGRLAEENGAELLIVTIPERTEINPENPHRFLYKHGNPFWDAQRRMIENLSKEEEGISHLELEEDLKNAFEEGKQVYGKVNQHMTPIGYKTVAETIYNRLVRDGYLENNRDVDFSDYPKEPITECPG
ncbi:MAG: SGNH/GDSL hydrolase family protein [Candidatus Nanohaloarchaea archaeon]|nr:SGNH/GDSL hydrolase family protein [Candidatus Nanohaloarchaea archaeon]